MMSEYRVNLEVYNGPLDLLLYLIRRTEVDVYDIPIATITEQYLQYVELLQALDPNVAGQFLVMAATLMEIKTRMLLPAPQQGEEGAEADTPADPRAELVRQLLEYKAFKDAAGDLSEARRMQQRRYPRLPAGPPQGPDKLDLEDAQIWDLFDAFQRLMASIGQDRAAEEILYDDTPMELHAEDIADRLRREGSLSFEQVFEGRSGRSEIVGLFLALLELVARKRVFIAQERNFGRIHIRLNPEPPDETAADARDAHEEQGDADAGQSRYVGGDYVPEPQASGSQQSAGEDPPDEDPGATPGPGA